MPRHGARSRIITIIPTRTTHAGPQPCAGQFWLGVRHRRRAQHGVRRCGTGLRLRRQFAGADLRRRSQFLRRDRAAAGVGRGVAGAEAADAAAHLRLSPGLDPGGPVQCRPVAGRGRRHRRRGDQSPGGACAGRGLDRRSWSQRSASSSTAAPRCCSCAAGTATSISAAPILHMAADAGVSLGVVVAALRDHADGLAVARSRDQPRHRRRGVLAAAGA